MTINIIIDILLFLMIFLVPSLKLNVATRIIITFNLCFLLSMNNNILIRKIRKKGNAKEECGAEKKPNNRLLVVSIVLSLTLGLILFLTQIILTLLF